MKYLRNAAIYLGLLWLLVLNFSFVNLFMVIDQKNLDSVAVATFVALVLWGIQFYGIRFYLKKRSEPAQEPKEAAQN